MTNWTTFRQNIKSDFLAGITGAVAGAPQAMGFAIIAGVSPIYGLYGAVVATLVGALTTSSTYLTIAPTNALALVVFSTLTNDTGALRIEKMFVLTLLVGLFQLGFGVLKLGSLSRFVSNAVMTGFITGAGLLIILGQVRHLTGYESSLQGGPLPRLWDWLSHPTQSNLQTTLIGVVAVIIIYSLHHTRFRSVATLVAIIVTTLGVKALGWHEVALVRDLSEIPAGLPAIHFPNLTYLPSLAIPALAMAVLASVQSAAISNSVPKSDNPSVNATRDLIGQGVANIVGSLFQSMPTGGSLSRTAVNISAGAKTRWSNLISALLIAGILIAFGNVIEEITLAALAGHLVVAAASLIQPKQIRMIWNVSYMGRIPMTVTLAATLLIPLEYSIYLGTILSLGIFIYTTSQDIQVYQLIPLNNGKYRQVPIPERLPDFAPIILSVHGDLYFAAVSRLQALLPDPANSQSTIVILRMRHNNYLGSTGIRFLQNYSQRLKMQGGQLLLAGVSDVVRNQLRRTRTLNLLDNENIFYADDVIFSATEQALNRAENLLKKAKVA